MNHVAMPKNTKIEKKYPAVVAALRKRVYNGEYTGVLPGVQKLAKDFDVNFMTVNKAINILVGEKLLYRIPNKGTFVNRTFRIALLFLFPKDARRRQRQTVYDDLIHGVEEAQAEKNMTMMFKIVDPATELHAINQLKSECDGMIVLGRIVNPKLKDILGDFPVVQVMGLKKEEDSQDHVTFDNHAIGRLAAEYLLEKKYKKFAFICSSQRQLLHDRGNAFRETIENAGKQVEMILPDASGPEVQDPNIDAILSQLDSFGQSTAETIGLFVPAAWMGARIVSYLKDKGIANGKQYEIVTCDKEYSELAKITPWPVFIDTHADLIGKKAVGLLSKRIESAKGARKTVLLEPEILTQPV